MSPSFRRHFFSPGSPAFLVTFNCTPMTSAQFRSYDSVDAAAYFLTCRFLTENPDTHSRYSVMARPWSLICGGNIVAARLLTLALLATAALVFPQFPADDKPVPAPWLALPFSTLVGGSALVSQCYGVPTELAANPSD